MTRKSFWTFLASIGIVRAQIDPNEMERMYREAQARRAGMTRNGKPKPKNGECPVCSTMAEPYTPESTDALKARYVGCEWCSCVFIQRADKPTTPR